MSVDTKLIVKRDNLTDAQILAVVKKSVNKLVIKSYLDNNILDFEGVNIPFIKNKSIVDDFDTSVLEYDDGTIFVFHQVQFSLFEPEHANSSISSNFNKKIVVQSENRNMFIFPNASNNDIKNYFGDFGLSDMYDEDSEYALFSLGASGSAEIVMRAIAEEFNSRLNTQIILIPNDCSDECEIITA